MSKLLKWIRLRLGVRHIVVRRREKLEWDTPDAHVLRMFFRSSTGQKLTACLDDVIVCAIEDMKPRDQCIGMCILRDYIFDLRGEEPEDKNTVGNRHDSEDWTTLPSAEDESDEV